MVSQSELKHTCSAVNNSKDKWLYIVGNIAPSTLHPSEITNAIAALNYSKQLQWPACYIRVR